VKPGPRFAADYDRRGIRRRVVPLLRAGPQCATWNRSAVLMLALVIASDTGSYFVGRAIGRVRLMPRVSPNKNGLKEQLAGCCRLWSWDWCCAR